MWCLQSLNATEKRYQELQMKVDSLGDAGGLNNVNQKAKEIKKEAEDLLNKATKGIEQLRSEYRKRNMATQEVGTGHCLQSSEEFPRIKVV